MYKFAHTTARRCQQSFICAEKCFLVLHIWKTYQDIADVFTILTQNSNWEKSLQTTGCLLKN